MRRIILIAASLVLLFTVIASAQTEWASFTKQDVEWIRVFYSITDKYYVVVGLKEKINNVDGFYYYEFADLQEAVTFADFFRRGRIKNVEHYKSDSGHTATWWGKLVAVITKFGLK